MSVLDRFRRLERVRREHAGDAPPPEQTLDRFREPPPPLAPEAAPYQTKPCVVCGAENGALAKRCRHCEANLETEAQRAHRAAQRGRERVQLDQVAMQRAQREAAEQQELERFRLERERRIASYTAESDLEQMAEIDESRPLIWLLRQTRGIRNPVLRAAVQIGMVGGFAAAMWWILFTPGRFPLLLLVLAVLGLAPLRGRRWRRWWR